MRDGRSCNRNPIIHLDDESYALFHGAGENVVNSLHEPFPGCSFVARFRGATSGIRYDTALAFARAGAAVALVGRREKEGAAAVKTIENTEGKAVFFQADLAAGEKVLVDVIARTVATYRRLDVEFNNAETQGRSGPITEASESDWDDVSQELIRQRKPSRLSAESS